MDTIKNTANYVSDKVQGEFSTPSLFAIDAPLEHDAIL